MRVPRLCLALIAALLISPGCNAQVADEETMGDLASALTHVSSAVDAYVRYDNPQPGLDGVALVYKAVEGNPAMLEPFSGYFIIARQSEKYSSVLVCDAERKNALLEDAGCTAVRFDAYLWRESPALTCNFVLNLQTTCSLP